MTCSVKRPTDNPDLFVGFDHPSPEIKFLAFHKRRIGKASLEMEKIDRRHIVEFDGDLAFSRARFDQCIREDVRRVLGKLIVCADVPKARSCNGLLFLDADDNLTGESVSGYYCDGAAKSVRGVTGNQEAGRISHIILRKCDQRVISGLAGPRSQ
jgi:hypothetical protein